MVKINYKSDFKIKEKSERVAIEVPFTFNYYVFNGKRYEVSFDGKVYKNCERKEDGSLEIFFNNHGLGIGPLKVERKYFISDKDFEDGIFNVVSVDKTDVYLTSGKTFEDYVETLVVPPYLKGDKGDAMTWETMTEEERKELVEEVAEAIDPEMVMTENEQARIEAEKERQASETQRKESFTVLKEQMETTISEGNVATDAANDVVKNYDAKVQEQDAKLSELGQKANDLENSINANRYGYNVTVNGLKGGVHTIETAIKDVPSKFRMLGQKITFRTENGDWATYYNESLSLDNYTNTGDWVQEVGISSVTGDINITNAPDYEDLTEAADGTLKFADKEYSSESFSGLGRVYLRKNIVDGANVLTQDMMSKPNTIYIIQYDYDLQGVEITVPEGCTLDFQGGSFNNGSIVSETSIDINASNVQIFDNVNINAHVSTSINVMWFGAKGDGVNDDTEAIQKAIDCIKHDYDLKGNGCVYFPNPINTYLISNTIILDEHWNVKVYSNTPIWGDRSARRALLTWIGEEDKSMMSISKYSYNENLENISFNGSNINGVIGLQIGEKNTQASGTKFSEYRNLIAFNCDKGLVVGGQTAEVAPDDAFLSFYNCHFYSNKTCGVDVSGGNTGVSFYDLRTGGNGKEPVTETKGCNVYIREGQVNIFGYISGGSSSNYPKDADIYQYYGGLRIYGAWSDTPGVFVYSSNSRWASIISSARHYEGSMTTENTPASIIWYGPQPLVLEGCSLYNNVELREGQGSNVIDIGTTFRVSGAGFTGDQVNKQLGYSSIGANNYIGKHINPEGLAKRVKSLIWSKPYDINQVKTVGNYTVTDYINPDNKQYGILGNAYSDVSTAKQIALTTGKCFKLSFYNDNILLATADGVAGEEIVWNNALLSGSFYNGKYLSIGKRKIIFNGEPPITGTWNAGDFVINSVPIINRPSGWICSESGTPGTWLAIGYCELGRLNKGITAQRPVLGESDSGFQFYDASIGRPIWWNGTKWIDATGVERP